MKLKEVNVFVRYLRLFIIATGVILFISCKSSFTQIGNKTANYIPYYLKIYEADSLYVVNNYQRSYEILDSLFKKYEPLNQEATIHRLYEYEKYIVLKNILGKKIGKSEFSKLLTKFGYKPNDIKEDSTLNSIRVKFKISDEDLASLQKKYLETVNLGLREKFLTIYEKDQNCRREIGKINIRKDSIKYKEAKKNVLLTDSINQIELKNIFKEYQSFPCPQYTGVISIKDNVWDNVYMSEVLMHQADKMLGYDRNYFLTFCFNELKKGRFNPVIYAMMNDRKFTNGEKMDYFMFLAVRDEVGETKISEINHKRKNIGLPTVEYEKWKYKLLNK